MSSDNTVADRLVSEARKKTARQESGSIGSIALGIGVLALLGSPISIVGWVLGLAAVITGSIGVKRPAAAKFSQYAIILGGLAILVGVFFFTLNIARM